MEVINHIIIVDNQARIRRKPHLKAEMVARMYVGTDYEIEDVMKQYNLTASEVHSAIAYYYDNQEMLDVDYDHTIADIRENAMTLGKFKAKIKARQQQSHDE
jgi:hypothetical protein